MSSGSEGYMAISTCQGLIHSPLRPKCMAPKHTPYTNRLSIALKQSGVVPRHMRSNG